ncbi:MAG TPA: apolipoprotein N-acyltransferase, partial [Acidimicrobiales bacterium]
LIVRADTLRPTAHAGAPRSNGAPLAAAVAAGLLIALSLPPFGFWPLGVLGLASFALLLRGQSPRMRAASGAGLGVGQYLVGLWWVTGFNVAGYLALVMHGAGCAALAALVVPARRRWGVVVGLPAALVVSDWLRGHFPFGGLPLGGTALGQVGGPLVSSARLGGTILVVGVTALAGAGLAELAWSVGRGLHAPRAAAVGPALRGTVALLILTAIVVAGWIGPDGGGKGPKRALRVALVQGGGPRGLHAVETDPEVAFQRQLNASRSVRGVDLVLWPEDVIQLDRPVSQTRDGALVADLALRLQTTVIAGVVEDQGPNRFRNAAVAWGPSGTIVASYGKVHRVPFGEYVPFRGIVEHLANLTLVPRDAVPGRGSGLMVTPAGRFGVVISYEVFFEDRARDAIRAGGQVLLVPTNASSYRISQVPTQEVAAAQLRAWETGRDTVQAAPTGYSAIIGHTGRVLARSTLGRQQVVVGAVEERGGRTLFVRLGDLPVVGLAVLALIALRWPRRRR